MKTSIDIDKIDFSKLDFADKTQEINFLQAYVEWNYRFLESKNSVEVILEVQKVCVKYRTGSEWIASRHPELTERWENDFEEYEIIFSPKEIKTNIENTSLTLIMPESIYVSPQDVTVYF